ncbi:hypothetical protein CERZMDRAFT_91137 [Cercospora zeae-maydis SCOH1-5]|uniref:Uncharacterized protein n=1 Tax=Cercospora zeae-maydis SCOH1-5 TaxID=717836 RepID=A0A6A6FBF9_9PEZI|nr:hypothetical protein CERZMDRAFT_91137 [Cercospora zeae-maydis SCOH1-5]
MDKYRHVDELTIVYNLQCQSANECLSFVYPPNPTPTRATPKHLACLGTCRSSSPMSDLDGELFKRRLP